MDETEKGAERPAESRSRGRHAERDGGGPGGVRRRDVDRETDDDAGEGAAVPEDKDRDQDEDEDAGEEAAAARARVGPTTAMVIASGGLDLGGRQFHYNERVTNANLRPFDLPSGPLLPITPGATASLELFPLAKTSWPVGRDVGVAAHGGYNFAKARIGTSSLDTTWYRWDVALRTRIHLGARGASPSLGVEAGWGRTVFAFHDPPGEAGVASLLPSVDYRYLRFGADARLPMNRFALMVGAAYRHLLSRTGAGGTTVPAAGALSDHFPRAAIKGIDAHVGGTWALAARLEARLVISYVRFWAAFNPRPGDMYVAGGGLDQMVHADVGVAAFF